MQLPTGLQCILDSASIAAEWWECENKGEHWCEMCYMCRAAGKATIFSRIVSVNSQQTFTCWKSTIETLKKIVKYVRTTKKPELF